MANDYADNLLNAHAAAQQADEEELDERIRLLLARREADPEKERSALVDVPMQVAGGVRDAAVETMQTVDEVARVALPEALDKRASITVQEHLAALDKRINDGPMIAFPPASGLSFITDYMTDRAKKSRSALQAKVDAGELSLDSTEPIAWDDLIPDVPAAETTAGSLAGGLSQGVTSFIGAGQAMKALKMGSIAMRSSKLARVLQGTAQGAVGDAVGFDPNADRLSNLITEYFPESLQNPITDYLAADKDDAWYEGRLKNALEGALVGSLADSAIAGGGLLKTYVGDLMGYLKNVRALKRAEIELGPLQDVQGGPVLLPAVTKTRTDAAIPLPAKTEAKNLELEKKLIFLDSHISELEVLNSALKRNAEEGLGRFEGVREAFRLETEAADSAFTPQGEFSEPLALALLKGETKKGGFKTSDLLTPEVEKEISALFESQALARKIEFEKGLEKPVEVATKTKGLGITIQTTEKPSILTGAKVTAKSESELSDKARIVLKTLRSVGKKLGRKPEEMLRDKALFMEADATATALRAGGASKAALEGLSPAQRELFDRAKSEAPFFSDDPLKALDVHQVNDLEAPANELIATSNLPPEIKAQAAELAKGFKGIDGLIEESRTQFHRLFEERLASYSPRLEKYEFQTFRGADPQRAVFRAKVAAKRAEAAARAKAMQTTSGGPVTKELQTPRERVREAAATAAKAAATPAQAKPHARIKNLEVTEEQARLLSEALKDGDVGAAGEIFGRHFNFHHMDSEQSVKQTINEISTMFAEEMQGVHKIAFTNEQTRALASDLGVREDFLAQALPRAFNVAGTENLGATVVASRSYLQGLSRTLFERAQKVVSGQATDLEKIEFRKLATLHAQTQAMVKGLQTNIARALQAHQIDVGSEIFDASRVNLDDLLKTGDEKSIRKMAERIAAAKTGENTRAISQAVRGGKIMRGLNAFTEWLINGYISAPQTHIVNAGSNAAVVTLKPIEEAFSSVTRAALKRDAAELQPLVALMHGYMQGLRVAFHGTGAAMGLPDATGSGSALTRMRDSVARQTAIVRQARALRKAGKDADARALLDAKSGELSTMARAFMDEAPALVKSGHGIEQTAGAISSEAFGLAKGTWGQKAIDAIGTAVRLPSRALTTTDEFFKAIHYYGELNRLAAIEGISNGKSGIELDNTISDLVKSPPKEMLDRAIQEAKKGTFTQDLESRFMQTMMAATNYPGIKWLVPFVRTPTNIFKYSLERTPLAALALREVREAMFKTGGRDRDLAIARMLMGGSFMYGAWQMAGAGRLTGRGPESPAEREALVATGWQPYSILINGKYYSYNRFDTYGQFLGLAADMSEVYGGMNDNEWGELATASLVAIVKQMSSKTYLRGVADLSAALTAEEHKVKRIIDSLIGNGVVPNIFAHARRIEDPMIREIYGSFLDPVRARTVGLSRDLPPRRNFLGDAVPYAPGFNEETSTPARVIEMFNPMTTSKLSFEPIMEQVRSLNVPIDMRSFRELPVGGRQTVELTPQQADRWIQLATKEYRYNGKGLRDALNELVQSETYKGLSDGTEEIPGTKVDAIKKTWAAYKNSPDVLAKLYQEFPEISAEAARLRMEVVRAKTPAPEQTSPLQQLLGQQ